MFKTDTVNVKEILESLSYFDEKAVPTILEGYVKPIHHIESYADNPMPNVTLVVDETEQDIYITSVKELKEELSGYPEDYFVFVKDSISTSVDMIWDEIYDVNIHGDETLIPNNVSLLTTVHMMS